MKIISQLLSLRKSVSFLGEKENFSWWQTNILNSVGLKFMQTNYPRTAHNAALDAVGMAATKEHDEKIGLGRVYHLFRLPHELEQSLHQLSMEQEKDISFPSSKDEAIEDLKSISNEILSVEPGPCQIGTKKTIRSSFGVQEIAKHYLSAFTTNVKCFPYFSDE